RRDAALRPPHQRAVHPHPGERGRRISGSPSRRAMTKLLTVEEGFYIGSWFWFPPCRRNCSARCHPAGLLGMTVVTAAFASTKAATERALRRRLALLDAGSDTPVPPTASDRSQLGTRTPRRGSSLRSSQLAGGAQPASGSGRS